jgi:hypothetical protein
MCYSILFRREAVGKVPRTALHVLRDARCKGCLGVEKRTCKGRSFTEQMKVLFPHIVIFKDRASGALKYKKKVCMLLNTCLSLPMCT